MSLLNVTVPDIGDFKDIPIIEILVKAGDRVAKDTPLIVLESDKATLDVPALEAGTIRELKCVLGDRVSAGSLVLTLDLANGSESVRQPTAIPLSSLNLPRDANSPANVQSMLAAKAESAVPSLAVVRSEMKPGRRLYGSPSIRRMAREFGIDLNAVQATGPRGRILREDLQRFVKTALAEPTARNGDTLGGITLSSWPKVDFSRFGKVERTPLTKIRRISGSHLTRNSVVIPHVTNFEEADITDLDAFRQALNADNPSRDSKLTLLPFLIKACAATLATYPAFNSSLDGDEMVLKRYFHIGFAADTPDGLIVPVIRDVALKGIRHIGSEAASLAAQARDGKLKLTDMQGGCFTISSLGGIGGTGFTPIINAPEVAILGVTRAATRPEWNGKKFKPRLILPLALSWDHRVIDGVAASRFLVHLSSLLQDFRRLTL